MSGAVHNVGSETNARIKERKADAKYILEKRLWDNIDNVLLLAKPQLPADDAEAVRIAKDIHDRLENLLRAECAAFDMKSMLSMDPGLRNTLGDAEADGGEEMLASIIKLWTDKAYSRESEMYPLFSAFVLFVQLRIKADMPIRTGMQTRRMARAAQNTKPRSVVARMLLPYACYDFKPHGMDEDEKIDNALRLCDADDPVQPYDADRKARHMFGIVEAKYSKTDTDIAFKQIIEYSRVLYRTQYDRRFTWALSVCGSEVRACVLLHDAVFASHAMDIGSPSGRLQFIQLLVNWCVCDKQQLGYDPTMRYDEAKRSYEIDCFDDSEPGALQTYVTNGFILAADSVLGRHTRCFRAHLKPAKRSRNNNSKAVVIKDAWAVTSTSPMEDPRSEITLMRSIEKGLADKDCDFKYPQLVSGGHVRVEQHGEPVIDSTDSIFALLEVDRMEPENGPEERATAKEKGPWVIQPLRAHRRIVMAPVGQHLKSVTEEHDLILVLAEAMRCHSGILKHCNVLHRDISMGNILVVYPDDNSTTGKKRPPSGLLIDFDYAISMGKDRKRSRAERSGTLPYMSIHNLENADCERTALDDWESLLYMVCWLGTIGLTKDERDRAHHTVPCLPINTWNLGSVQEIADMKRSHMHDKDIFEAKISRHFSKKYPLLQYLAIQLHKALFLHEDCPVGTRSSANNMDSEANACIKEREAEAEYVLEKRLWQDIDNVLLLAKPQSPANDAEAVRIANDIHTRLDDLLMGDYEEVNLKRMLIEDSGLRRKLDKAAEIRDEETLASITKLWTDKAFSQESKMYPLFSAFVLFVQLRIKADMPIHTGVQTRRMARAAQNTKPRSVVARMLLPYVGANFKPHGIDEDKKFDKALCLYDADDPVQLYDADRKARHMFGIVEIKYSKEDTDIAFKQINEYSRAIFCMQYDRRFTWALPVCGCCKTRL
ncbi:hypothetical protein IWW50_000600 [Coemansia erecta]|nr:hypothetical protein IWW50_000600 [Coemansia erecta]